MGKQARKVVGMTQTMDRAYKTYENRVRRMALRQGLHLQKSRTRNAEALDFGLYRIVEPYTNFVVAGGSPLDYSMSLPEVEEFLSGEQRPQKRT